MKKAAVFGVGSFFEQHYKFLIKKYELIVLADNNPDNQRKKIHEIECVPPEELKDFSFDVLIVAVYWKQHREKILEQVSFLDLKNVKIIMAEECTPPVFDNKNFGKGFVDYTDEFNNHIVIEDNVPVGNSIIVRLSGVNNFVKIEKGVIVSEQLHLVCIGEDNVFHMEENTSVMSMHCEVSEHGRIHIGKDCMFSWGIQLIQHPAHPIYEKETGKRVNVSKSIDIGEHVWIGKEAILLNGFAIGSGSVVGHASVSSGKFGEDQIVVGNPAKVIRENICWKRDVVGYYPLNSL